MDHLLKRLLELQSYHNAVAVCGGLRYNVVLTTLCISWLYVVNIRNMRGTHSLRIPAGHFC